MSFPTTLASRRPSLWRVARNQFALIDASKRFPLLVAVLAGAAAFGMSVAPNIPESLFPFSPLLLVTVVWPVLVWRGESPAKRTYHRIMPVNAVVHDLLKVAAGALWLWLAVAVILSVYLLAALLRDGAVLLAVISPTAYINFFTATLIVYLWVSIIPILTNRPIEWIIGLASAFIASIVVFDIYIPGLFGSMWEWIVVDLALAPALSGAYQVQMWSALWDNYWTTPWAYANALAERQALWLTATAAWTAVGIFAVFAASYIANRRQPS